METNPVLTPLRPREFFGTPWSGEGEWKPPTVASVAAGATPLSLPLLHELDH